MALTLAVPAVSYAATAADSTTTVHVRYRDLDLSKPDNAAILLQRIDAAAMEACGASRESLREYRQTVRASACHEASISRAVAALNVPTVTALYTSHSVVVAAN